MDWPTVITPVGARWRWLGGARSGGQTAPGTEQIIAAPGAKWHPTLTLPLVRPGKSA